MIIVAYLKIHRPFPKCFVNTVFSQSSHCTSESRYTVLLCILDSENTALYLQIQSKSGFSYKVPFELKFGLHLSVYVIDTTYEENNKKISIHLFKDPSVSKNSGTVAPYVYVYMPVAFLRWCAKKSSHSNFVWLFVPPCVDDSSLMNVSKVKAGTQEPLVSPLTITAENVTSATTTQVTKVTPHLLPWLQSNNWNLELTYDTWMQFRYALSFV